MQSSLAVPYDEPVEDVRHRLFVHECRMFMQTINVAVLDRPLGRVLAGSAPRIADARFDSPTFSPAIRGALDCDIRPSVLPELTSTSVVSLPSTISRIGPRTP